MKKTRAEAIAAKELFYNTRKPCKHGHLSARSTITMECLECRKGWSKNERDKMKLLRQTLAS